MGGLGRRQRKPTATNGQVTDLGCGKFVSFQQQQQQQQQELSSNSQQQLTFSSNNQQAFDYRLPNKLSSFYGQQQQSACDTSRQQQQQHQDFAPFNFGYFDSFSSTPLTVNNTTEQQEHHLAAEMGKLTDQNVHLDLSFGSSCSDQQQQQQLPTVYSTGCSDYLIGYNNNTPTPSTNTTTPSSFAPLANSLSGAAPLAAENSNYSQHGRYHCEPCRLHFVEESQLLSHNRSTHVTPKTSIRKLACKAAKKQPMNMTRQPMNMTMESIGKRIYEEESEVDDVDEDEVEGHNTAELVHTHCDAAMSQENKDDRTDGDWPFQCASCAQRLQTAELLHAHMRAHNAAKPHKCAICGLGFMHKADRKRHETSIHHQAGKEPSPHVCDLCSRTFTRRSDLNVHKRRLHSITSSSASTRISCQGCAQIFASEKEATRHLCSSSKKRGDGLRCELCNAMLNTRVEWGVHMWKHTKDAAYIITSETDPLPVAAVRSG